MIWPIRGLTTKNTQIAHTIQYQKTKQPNQKVDTDIFAKKTIAITNWHMKKYSKSRECKSEPEWDITPYLSKWLSWKKQEIIDIRE